MAGYQKEDQLGALRETGVLQRDVPGWDPSVAQGRVDRQTPFHEQLSPATSGGKGGIEDRVRDGMVRRVWQGLSKTGVTPITVVNLMPWQVDIVCGVFPHFVKRADWKKGEDFHMKTFHVNDVRVDMADMGDGKYAPSPLLPVDIADEFLRKYVGADGELDEDENGTRVSNKPGGMFVFVGTEQQIPKDFAEQMAAAHARLESWFWSQFKLGTANWERYKHDPMQITERYKDAAKYLFKNNLIDALPEWAAMGKGETGIKTCPNCAEPIKKAAKQCRFCGAVLDADSTGFSRAGGPMPKVEPEPEPQPRQASHAPVSSEPSAGLSDKAILDLPDDQVPDPSPARPNKPRRNNQS